MSAAAWLIDLERLPDAELATRHAVRLAVVKLLTETWRRALPAHDAQRAENWINWGIESLLGIGDVAEWDEDIDDLEDDEDPDLGPATQLFFQFQDAEWAQPLAAHWLALALSERRADLQAMLLALGYRASWEDFAVEWRFVRDAERTGLVGRDRVEWQLPRLATDDDDALGEDTRSAVERVRRDGACECAYCAYLRAS